MTTASIETTTAYGTCPASTDGTHAIEWLQVPAQSHNGIEVAPPHRRGFCWNCDQRFTEGV